MTKWETLAIYSATLEKALRLGGSLLKFDGFRMSSKQEGYYGTFLWQARVTFNSGRIQPIYYHQTIFSPDIAGLYAAWEESLKKAYEIMEDSIRLKRLVRYGLNGSPTRAFKSVVWEPFGYSPFEGAAA